MNELFARITNLSYEIFGVILPGLILNIFLLLLWAAVGSFSPIISADLLPSFSMDKLQHLLDSLTVVTGVGAFIPIVVLWYFLGHLVLWISRSGPMVDDKTLGSVKRVGSSLIFKIPKPEKSYDEKLSPLYDVVCKEFSKDRVSIEWRQFYPLAKCFIAQRLTSSLVVTYQNKYTFHRSVIGASVFVFWLSILSIVLVSLKTIGNFNFNNIVLLFIVAGQALAVFFKPVV